MLVSARVSVALAVRLLVLLFPAAGQRVVRRPVTPAPTAAAAGTTGTASRALPSGKSGLAWLAADVTAIKVLAPGYTALFDLPATAYRCQPMMASQHRAINGQPFTYAPWFFGDCALDAAAERAAGEEVGIARR